VLTSFIIKAKQFTDVADVFAASIIRIITLMMEAL
jgi:hypothetical protein